jgi:hypothetical protein
VRKSYEDHIHVTEKNPLRVVQNVLQQVRHNSDTKHREVKGTGLAPELARLREFQGARIAQTYADFAAQPQYAAVMQFFLEDLYGPRDFSQRDYDVQRLYNFLQKFVPAEMLKLGTDALELRQLSDALDQALLQALRGQSGESALTPALYARAYRQSDNIAARERQIELLVRVMHDSADAARLPLTGIALKMVKQPAEAAGWHELYAFLERGRQAFRQVRHPQQFIEAIAERETLIMRRILARAADPFRTG